MQFELGAKLASDITDIHVHETVPSSSIIFPGPRRASDSEMPLIHELLARCQACRKEDFMVSVDGVFFRGRREVHAVDGVWYSLRRMPDKPPTLDALPSAMPRSIVRMLLSERLREGGFVFVIGSPGSGKTTTASAIVASRLIHYGGFAYTVEDPPEMPLNGWHGNGYCRQTWVPGDNGTDWESAVRGTLRSQPSHTHPILFIGEIRDALSARSAIRAAANGFLVVATGFGTDIPSGIDAFGRLIREDAGGLAALSSVLRLVIHQNIRDGILVPTFLASADATSPVSTKIRNGQIVNLMTDIQYQSNRAMLGETLL